MICNTLSMVMSQYVYDYQWRCQREFLPQFFHHSNFSEEPTLIVLTQMATTSATWWSFLTRWSSCWVLPVRYVILDLTLTILDNAWSQMDMFDMAFELGANFRIINVQVQHSIATKDFRIIHDVKSKPFKKGLKSFTMKSQKLLKRAFPRWLWRLSWPTPRCSSTSSTLTGTSTGR